MDDFISYRIRKGSIMRTVIKGRILYSLSSAGYRELSEFLSSPLMEYHTGRQGTWHQENMPRTAKNYSVHSSTVGIVFLKMAGILHWIRRLVCMAAYGEKHLISHQTGSGVTPIF